MREDQPAYDQTITVFSPDGRLYQVEYAREAVKRGATSAGLKYKDGLMMFVEKRVLSRLIEERSKEKMFKISNNIVCTSSGLVADTQVLVDYMQYVAQLNKINYNEPITVSDLVKKLCNVLRSYTQFGGVRPFGVAFLIGGIDHRGIHLFETDVSGAFQVYDAGCIGQNCKDINEFFETNYKSDLDKNQAMILGLQALKKVIRGELTEKSVDVLVLEKDKGQYFVPREELKKYIEGLK